MDSGALAAGGRLEALANVVLEEAEAEDKMEVEQVAVLTAGRRA